MTKFIMLVGLPGSGKSTYAKQLLEADKNAILLSSDAIRGELWGDEGVQSNATQVFELMKKRAIEALKGNKTVIYDATNLVRKHRMGLLTQLSHIKDAYKECHIVWDTIENCILKDSKRERVVGKEVILKMVKNFQVPFVNEGWDDIKIIHSSPSFYLHGISEWKLNIAHDNPHHPGTIRGHILRTEIKVYRLFSDLPLPEISLLSTMAFYHDDGKLYTKSFINSKGKLTKVAHYYNHQYVSSYLCCGTPESILSYETRRMFPNIQCDSRIIFALLVELHMEPFFVKQQSNYVKQIQEEYPNLWKYVELFHKCDVAGA